MAKIEETKQNHAPASDLDDDIFAILNSSRPTYPGGGPNTQQPATKLNRSHVSSTQTTQRFASRPTQTEQTTQRTAPRATQAEQTAEQNEPWRPVIQPQVSQKNEPLPRLQKRPIVSHAIPDQEDPIPSETWPDLDTLEEIPEPEPKDRIRLPKGRKMWAIVIAVYVLILVGGFAARLIINAIQDKDKPDNTSLAANNSGLSDSSNPDNVQNAGEDSNSAVDIVAITPDTEYLAVLEDNTAAVKVSLSAHGAANSSHLSWSSSDEGIATVNETGIVKGIAAGTCTISVSAKNNPDVSADIDVTVRNLEERDGCIYIDDILIVNKTYSLPESYDPKGLTPETQKALDQMIADAYQEGLNLYDASDYRSYQDQLTVYQEYCVRDGWEEADTYSARPGHSEHQTGMVIDFNDISNEFDDTEEAKWLEEHCAEYGFIIRFPEEKEAITGYQYESWHVRYVGVETAQEIHRLGICLEEYLGVDSAYQEEWPNDPCNPDSP